MRSGLIGVVCVAAATVNCASRRAAALGAPLSVPFELRDDLPLVRARVNGVDLLLILDSGSGALVLDDAAARAAHVQPSSSGLANGRTPIQMGRADSLTLGGAAVYGAVTAIVDMGPVQRRVGFDVRGTIGYDLFERYVVTVDYHALTMTLTEPSEFRPDPKATPTPLRVVGRVPVVTASIATRSHGTLPAELHVDLGSSAYAIRLSRRFLDRHPIESDTASVPVQLGAGVGGSDTGVLYRLPWVEIGTARFLRPSVVLSTQRDGAFGERASTDGTIGAGVLRGTRVTFDYAHGALYLIQLVHLTAGDSVDGSGLTLEHADSSGHRWVVRGIVPGSAGAIAGLEAGDELIALDDRSIESFGPGQTRARLRQSGTRCSITVRRGGEIIRRVLDLKALA